MRKIQKTELKHTKPCADPENFLRWGEGPNFQTGSDGKFQHGKN